MRSPRALTLAILRQHVRYEGRCWLWTGPTNEHGYGRANHEGRKVYLHRLVYEWTYGALGEGQIVLHACDTPNCINPAHLRAGTQSENVGDMHAKGRRHYTRRTHCPKGHAYSPDNTQHHITGYQRCRECMNAPRRKANQRAA